MWLLSLQRKLSFGLFQIWGLTLELVTAEERMWFLVNLMWSKKLSLAFFWVCFLLRTRAQVCQFPVLLFEQGERRKSVIYQGSHTSGKLGILRLSLENMRHLEILGLWKIWIILQFWMMKILINWRSWSFVQEVFLYPRQVLTNPVRNFLWV